VSYFLYLYGASSEVNSDSVSKTSRCGNIEVTLALEETLLSVKEVSLLA